MPKLESHSTTATAQIAEMPAAKSEILDCLVIGGGPAGLTAGIYLGRFRRRVLVVDKGWSRAEWITKSHNLPGFPDGIAGPVLLGNLRTQARLYGAALETGIVDILLWEKDALFNAKIGTRTLLARTIILATGVVENKPPVAHVADAVKRGLIRTCPICDGYENIGKTIAVLGNGEHAAAEALFLRTFTKDVCLLLMETDPTILSDDTKLVLKAASISVRHVVVGSVTMGDSGVTVLGVEDAQPHRYDAIYSAFGTTPQTMLAIGLGAQMDSSNRLFVDTHQATSIEGMYAAGDLVRGLNQISVAEGEAATAATSVHNRLPKAFA
jgi:thioredoxin reductase (NADPH)